jgi:polysaccharide pyruvyl transferase WcaK-like protein
MKKMINILMVGYSGANNTGAEALLQADIEDVRAVLGPEAHITVPTLNEANLRRYLQEGPTLKITRIPTFFFRAIRRMVKECDLLLLVEGSTYMDTWGSPLLWMFLWASHCAQALGKPSLAYAVDAGALSKANQRRVRSIASRTSLIITRNRAAAKRLRDLGVTAPMESTADNAFTFRPHEADRGRLSSNWPQAARGVVGFAMVDFTLFPAVMRPWGPREQCYKWPYYLSNSPKRTQASRMLARGYAKLADRVVMRSGKAAAFLCMEQLDEAMATKVQRYMRHPESVRIFSARHYDASQMTSLLRELDLLVTSRFHAAVLSLAAGVPQVAVGHDTRLAALYGDLGLSEQWFIDLCSTKDAAWNISQTKLFSGLTHRVDMLLAGPGLQNDLLRKGYLEHLTRARQNKQFLTDFIAKNFGYVNSTCPQTPNQYASNVSHGGAICAV